MIKQTLSRKQIKSKALFLVALLSLMAGDLTKDAFAKQKVTLETGIPLPLVIHGSAIKYSGNVSPLGTAALEHGIAISPSFWLVQQGRFSFNYAGNTLGSRIAYATLSSGLSFRKTVVKSLGMELWLSAAFSFVYSSLRIDENINLTTYSAGIQIRSSLQKKIRGKWTAGPALGVEEYLAPINKKIWFNRRMGGFRFMTVGVALSRYF